MADATQIINPQPVAQVQKPAPPIERTMVSLPGTHGKTRKVHSRLTRASMENIVRSGSSVMYNGTPITSIDQLPTDSELALSSGNSDEVEKVRAEKQSEIDRLQAELKSLKAKPEQGKPEGEPAKK